MGEILLAVAAVITAVGTGIGGAAVLSQLTAPGRLRTQLAKELEIHDKLIDSPSRQLLERSIRNKTARLASYELARFPRKVYSAVFAAVFSVVSVLASVGVTFHNDKVRLDSWLIVVMLTLMGSLVFVGYINAYFQWTRASKKVRRQRLDMTREAMRVETTEDAAQG